MKTKTALRVIVTAIMVCASYGAVAESAPKLELQQYEGQVVVLDFWGDW